MFLKMPHLSWKSWELVMLLVLESHISLELLIESPARGEEMRHGLNLRPQVRSQQGRGQGESSDGLVNIIHF